MMILMGFFHNAAQVIKQMNAGEGDKEAFLYF